MTNKPREHTDKEWRALLYGLLIIIISLIFMAFASEYQKQNAITENSIPQSRQPYIIYNNSGGGQCSTDNFPDNFNEAFYTEPPTWYLVLNKEDFVCGQDYYNDNPNIPIPGWCRCRWK